ncbi:Mannan polymerase complex subunit mnn9 [Phytophthora cinnamomi]|uniref:Mannan polymerase complex subunit mnn9 n=1 Tax=Phytophthora cinnamomi TaxID=4785 RepID=UPI003559954A|nr:Mannan polymerase complex subunit mnn9 [Phytophthora cinnamomi]
MIKQPAPNTPEQQPVPGIAQPDTPKDSYEPEEAETEAPKQPQSNTIKQPAPNTPEPPVTSVLHPITPPQDPLNPDVAFRIQSTKAQFDEYEESFPQHGKTEPGRHYRIENTPLLSKLGNRESNSVLIICVFNDAESWGKNRTVNDFFNLVVSFNYPKEKISIAMLTSSLNEFGKVRALFANYIQHYLQLSLVFRNDFAQHGLSRDNRHDDALQGDRRRMLARYRNYALLSTMESWHQHVVWLDADVTVVPSGLVQKMVQSGRDIVEPICLRKNEDGEWYDYDANAWVGQRKVRPAEQDDSDFVPGPLNAKHMHNMPDKAKELAPLDSVGGTMLYVRAEVHRQGVVFPMHYVIGSEWGREGYDGIETEGLCYTAHFLGYKCWGMPKDVIQHAT